MARMVEDWEHAYELHVDGQPTGVQMLGSSKTEAYEMVADQWKLTYPDQPLPKRYRCKLEPIDSTFQGYK